MFRVNVVLLEPEIPQNTGSIARTCAAVGAKLHLIMPLGFSVDDRHLKRAGLDYWHMVDIRYYENIKEFFSAYPGENIIFISKKAAQTYDKIDYTGNIFLVFGKETTGLPDSILKEYWKKCYRIPMKTDARSLNLSNAVSVVVYEAFRQNNFIDLKIEGSK